MIKRIRSLLVKFILVFFIVSIGSVILFRFLPVPITPLMVIRLTEQVFYNKPFVLKKDWCNLEQMGVNIQKAVIAAEDQKFEEHSGFDFDAIRKAQEYNKRHKGKKMKGASTISQQTAKNVFLWPSRSWIRKGFEVYFTFLIELFWSKDRILEVYLNVIETGDGIYGSEAAAMEYFNHTSQHLSEREAALIAAVLPNPRKWSPVKPSSYVSKKAGRIQYFMSTLEWSE
jgi:monofunctional biosynthetic peptidoglycan transglycosylase